MEHAKYICYFFGTFNPPHIGHLKIAQTVCEEFGFDKIIFVPNRVPCHKKADIEPYHRYNMLKLLPLKNWGEVSDVEFHLDEPSYTYRTINSLYKGVKIPFIIGYDAFIDIEKWKNPSILKEKLKFMIVERKCSTSKAEIEALKNKGWDFDMVDDFDFIDVSSDGIRKNVQNGKSIDNMVTKEVERYIYENGLYKKMA